MFAFVLYAQSSMRVETVRYQPSDELQRHLAELNDKYLLTLRLLSSLRLPKSAVDSVLPKFPQSIRSERDFQRLREDLGQFSEQRTAIKQAVVQNLENSVQQIETKLRRHVESIQAKTDKTPATPTPGPAVTPATTPSSEPATLYSKDVDQSEIKARVSTIKKSKEFLEGVTADSQNPENIRLLADAMAELDNLQALIISVMPVATEEATAPPTPSPQQSMKVLNAEKVAERLSQLLASVRGAVLSSWTLDEALEQTVRIVDVEADRRRVSDLQVGGIWLSASAQIALVVLGSVVSAFLVLVMADLTQSLLDTAKNTRVIADKS